jgi:hypothetical protein
LDRTAAGPDAAAGVWDGEGRLELEYDPDKTDINQVMVLLLTRTSAPRSVVGRARHVGGGDVVGAIR